MERIWKGMVRMWFLPIFQPYSVAQHVGHQFELKNALKSHLR